ncbi:uncharacterized protein CCR75_002108 [Bremia lactucae]|uniref:L-type lectin-like domain-containing protein n=1 Tax=Bremia lactucae TaxID=4779 RepID=A0A976IAV9_BRELC|nr:hypothetical protein CCR75_002108 [Bremia lactucae]
MYLSPLLLVCEAALFALFQPSPSNAKRLDYVSFEKPFDKIDEEGLRQVGENFEYGGDTAVNRHFARLTPDRQSKRGYIWGKQKLLVKDFAVVFTFRISGQAQSLFGDGLALWLTTSEFVRGDNHGFTGEFKGFGILFDTFVNQEHSGGHKDVTFFENDGTKTLDQLNDMEKLGCMAPGIRVHEKNAAFNPSLNMSRAKITYTQADQHVTISIDADASGNWVKCHDQRVNIAGDWISDAYVGVSASTGGLADNHDVISVNVYDDVIDSLVDRQDQKHRDAVDKSLEGLLNNGTNDEKMQLIKRKYTHLLEEFEFKLNALKESTENTILKLKQQGIKDEENIRKLEAWANGAVVERVQSSVSVVRDHMDSRLKESVMETAAQSSGWKTPFFIVLLIIAGLTAVGYQKYQALRKTHFL